MRLSVKSWRNRRPVRHADGQLTLAADATGDEKAGDVRAHDEQNQTDGEQHRRQGLARAVANEQIA